MGAVSPLVLDAFEQELLAYPDPAIRDYILSGIAHGFHVGYSNSGKLLRSSNRNLKSASLHKEVIDKYLAKEVALNRVAGPFPIPPIHGLHISPFGVIPKRGQPGQWRLILDLSSPRGYSVNDGIPKDPYSLHYTSVDDAIRILLQLGPGELMAKFDVESAYRNMPIHHEDRYLLGMSWRNQYYIDLTLPFGLRSAPYVFNSIATAVEWILHNNYDVRFILHYLDDFLTMAPANSRECYDNVTRARALFNRLGLPLHPDKCVVPVLLFWVSNSIRSHKRLASPRRNSMQHSPCYNNGQPRRRALVVILNLSSGHFTTHARSSNQAAHSHISRPSYPSHTGISAGSSLVATILS